MRRIVLGGLLSGWVLLLAGCGFQLRGQAQLPPELSVVYVQSQTTIGTPPGALSRKLRRLLADNGVTVTRDPAQAKAVIAILREGSGRRVVAVDRLNVKRQYFLAYDAAYQVTLANGKTLIPLEGLSANRTLLFDENAVLGFEAAQEILVDNMAEDLAWRIVRRLQAIGS
ncbi:MAG: hypothetical protein KDJ54_04575 [Candidatus Competibacteraceae bacterium]|nr:hypothetical protein [Candidatus Competibacteraceae bacterium]